MIKPGRLAVFVGVCVAWGMAADSRAAQPPPCAYHYVSLMAALPPGLVFFQPIKVTHRKHVYGTAYLCSDTCIPSVAVYRDGAITILHEGIAYSANKHGMVAGSVFIDPDNFIEQAALFNDAIETIPRLPGEYTSHVLRLTDSGIALVESFNTEFVPSYYLYDKHGRITPLDFGADPVGFLDVNDHGVVGGTSFPGPNGARAFRFDPSVGRKEVLNPTPTEPESYGQGINKRGDVLGYSFVAGGLERIGAWRNQTFHTSFVEGTPEFPTVSNRLLWNEQGLIVITRSFRDPNSYIVPEPNLRLNLADLADTLPIWTEILDLNGPGDLIGWGGSSRSNIDDVFLLERVDCREP
jgi:hypothetical protein